MTNAKHDTYLGVGAVDRNISLFWNDWSRIMLKPKWIQKDSSQAMCQYTLLLAVIFSGENMIQKAKGGRPSKRWKDWMPRQLNYSK